MKMAEKDKNGDQDRDKIIENMEVDDSPHSRDSDKTLVREDSFDRALKELEEEEKIGKILAENSNLERAMDTSEKPGEAHVGGGRT